MLLRHTVSALALATTVGLNALPATGLPALATPTSPSAGLIEEVGGGPGATCVGCVAAGAAILAVSGWAGVFVTFMVGGSQAVTAGAALVTCSAACIKYVSQT